MQGKTHRVGGMLCCLSSFALLRGNGMLLEDVNPLIQLSIMYPFALYGSVLPDLDNNWNASPGKDIVSYGLNKILHLTTPVAERVGGNSPILALFNAKHRSWQTHSDLFLICMLMFSSYLINTSSYSLDYVFIRLIVLGLALGVVSHLILDMLTPEGVWSIFAVIISKVTPLKSFPVKLSFVPKSSFFKTGGPWEVLVNALMWIACIIVAFYIIISFSPYKIVF